MKGLCIFDFDGTLANTLISISHFGNKALCEHGLKPLDTKLYRQMVGNGAKILLKRMVKASLGKEDEEITAKVKATYDSLYDANPAYLVEPYEGMEKLLFSLKREGWLIAVNSNKPDHLTKFIAEEVFGKEIFDYILGQRDDIPKKPAPDGARIIRSALGAENVPCFYIGDSNVDVETGKAAGLPVVGVAWGFRGREELEAAEADFIAQAPMDIALFLKKEKPEIS